MISAAKTKDAREFNVCDLVRLMGKDPEGKPYIIKRGMVTGILNGIYCMVQFDGDTSQHCIHYASLEKGA